MSRLSFVALLDGFSYFQTFFLDSTGVVAVELIAAWLTLAVSAGHLCSLVLYASVCVNACEYLACLCVLLSHFYVLAFLQLFMA